MAEMDLLSKLSEIRKMVEVVQKDQSGFNYKYTSITEILAKLSAGMKKYRVLLTPQVVPGTAKVESYTYTKIRPGKNGSAPIVETITEFLATAQMEYIWCDLDSQEKLSIPWVISGSQSDPSQAFGSALTYGLRYFLTQFFQVAQPTDDPDYWRSKQKEAEAEEDKAQAKSIVDSVHKLVTEHLEKVSGDKPKIAELVKQYAKDKTGKPSTNYYTITDPVVAAKLYEAVCELIGKEE